MKNCTYKFKCNHYTLEQNYASIDHNQNWELTKKRRNGSVVHICLKNYS